MTVFLLFFLERRHGLQRIQGRHVAEALALQSVRVPSCTITSSIKHVVLCFDIFDIVFVIEGHTGL